jgi:hypothetical protein
MDIEAEMSPPEFVYHYTNAAGLLGIVSTRNLWATDIEFMNDAEELTYARTTVLGDLRAWADEIAPPGTGSEDGLRADVLRSIAEELEHPAWGEPSSTYHIYAACFCEDGDLLSQWRAYGGDGGYAIGFRTFSLLGLAASFESIHFEKVTYGLDGSRPYLDAMLETVAQRAAGFPGATGNIRLMTRVLPTIAAIKHPTFAQEREWRLLSTGWDVPEMAFGFRTGSVGLVPFIEVSFPGNAVAQVIVGPGRYPEVRKRGVRQLLERHGLSDVEVVGTSSPLRL